jgi:hypothetical protein
MATQYQIHTPHAIQRWLARLELEALRRAASAGPLAGPIRPGQVPWSRILDRIEHELQREAA